MIRSVFLALNGIGLVSGIIVNAKTEDLYKGNVHRHIGWVATGIVLAHALIDVLLRFAKQSRTKQSKEREGVGSSFRNSMRTVYQSICSRLLANEDRLDRISRPENGRDVPRISQHHPFGEYENSESDDEVAEDEYKSLVPGRRSFLRDNFIHRDFSRRSLTSASFGLLKILEFLYKAIDWTILVVGYITLVTGGVTYTGIFVSGQA